MTFSSGTPHAFKSSAKPRLPQPRERGTTPSRQPQKQHAETRQKGTMPPAMDGFLQRRTRPNGRVEKRYFRIEGYQLKYYSDHLTAIKATRNDEGPYQYDAVGSAAEAIDLRGETPLENAEDTQFLLKHGSRRLEVRLDSKEQRDQWVKT